VDWTAIYPFWFGGGPEIDEEIVRRFSAAYSDAFAGKVSASADATGGPFRGSCYRIGF